MDLLGGPVLCTIMEGTGPAAPSTWWQRTVSKEADRERLGRGERVGNVIAIIFIALFALAVRFLQEGWLSGFFAPAFGMVEQAAFYGSMLFGTVPSFARALTGRRSAGRLMDILGSAVFVAAWSYLLAVFPFDFGWLVALLPADVPPSLGGAANGLFRLAVVIAMIVSVIGAAYSTIMHIYVRQELRRRGGSEAFVPERAF